MSAISILATSGSVCISRQFTISARGEGRAQPSSLRLIGWRPSFSGSFWGNGSLHRVPYRSGRPCLCLLLSEADLIVRAGDEGVWAQGSLGQPYFLTLVFSAHGDGGQRVKLNLIPRFPLPAVMYIHRSSRGPDHFWKFTKRLTAKINNKKNAPC